MKVLILFVLGVFFIEVAKADNEQSSYIEKSRAAVSQFAKELKSKLQAALQKGGAKKALEVCNIEAPEIRDNVQMYKGLEIKRVALKNRNPDNVPDEWEEAVLNEFIERYKKGDNLKDIEKIYEGEEYFRYMKAIPMGGVCVTCHGVNISEDLKVEIEKYYPEDKAIGFKPGDIRGAFSVKIKK